jgi:uncharacterized protein
MKDQYLSYHKGERAVQARAGVGSEGLGAEEMYRAAMPAGVRRFLSAQQLAVLSTMDADGRIWASMRSGAPGFLGSLDDHTVEIGGYAHPDDPIVANLGAHSEAGVVVVHLAARHRVRLNGTASARPDGKLVLTTKQVYGNCPQYIQARTVVGESEASLAVSTHRGETLDVRQRIWVENADTLFLATANPGAGADASHRGGKPGFIRVEDGKHLLIPDYAGNKMFNSLGNIASYPRAGLLVPDFQSGAALELSGTAQILWDDPRMAEFEGAQRLIAFKIERTIELPQATLLRLEFQSYSPTLP